MMPDPGFEEEFRSLRTLRSRLTVAMLAVEQLCRKFCALPPAQRLCSFATDALRGMRDEVAALERRLLHREQRNAPVPKDRDTEHDVA